MAKPTNEPPRALLAQITEAIASLRYGTIHITVQDSRVVQIEKVEKIRLTQRQDADPIPPPVASPTARCGLVPHTPLRGDATGGGTTLGGCDQQP